MSRAGSSGVQTTGAPPLAPPPWWRRWRTTILAAPLLVALVVGIAEVAEVRKAYRRIEAAAVEQQAETAEALATATRLLVARYTAIAQTAAQVIFAAPAPAGALGPLLARIRHLHPDLEVVAAIDRSGRVVGADPDVAPGLDVSQRSYYLRLLDGDSAFVSDLLYGRLTRSFGIVISAAGREPDGMLRGVVLLGLPAAALARAVEPRPGGDVRLLVVDRSGRLIVHSLRPDLDWAGRDYSGLPLVAEALAGRPVRTSSFASPATGERMLGAMVPVPELGWAVGVFRPVEAVLAPARREQRIVLAKTAVVLALGLSLALLLSTWLSRPIAALAAGVAAIAHGDLGHRVTVRGRHELHWLAEDLNLMAAQLERLVADLEAANRRRDRAVAEAHTERHRLETTLESLPDGVLICDADGVLAVANEAARRLLGCRYVPGLSLRDGPGPQPALRTLAGEALAPEELPLRRALRGERVVERRLAVDVGRGVERYVSMTAVPVIGRGGETLGAVAVVRDVTDEQRLEALRDLFIARASHELRTPLTVVKGHLAFLAKRHAEHDPEAAGLVSVAQRHVDQMAQLIGRLLDTSRLAAGHLELECEPLELDRVVAEAAAQAEPVARNKGVALVSAVEGRLPLVGDRLKLGRVILNLLDNAIKHTPAGGSVRIEGAAVGAAVELRVRDTGAGIPREHLERIFEPFFQVGSATGRRKAAGPGAGLGLTIARRLVELHGGRIWAESDGPGRGSTFVVRLPVVPVESRTT